MKLSIVNIQNQGELDKEVMTLKVEEDCNLRSYIVTEAQISREDVVSASFRNTFWFPEKEVKAGDYILLFSREGADSEKKNTLETTSHILHWRSDHPVWNETEDAAVLFEVSNWVMEKTRSFVSFV